MAPNVAALSSTMSDEGIANYCFECKQPLTEIDNRGRRLWGCMNTPQSRAAWGMCASEDVKSGKEQMGHMKGDEAR
jgi:hypothetical protein